MIKTKIHAKNFNKEKQNHGYPHNLWLKSCKLISNTLRYVMGGRLKKTKSIARASTRAHKMVYNLLVKLLKSWSVSELSYVSHRINGLRKERKILSERIWCKMNLVIWFRFLVIRRFRMVFYFIIKRGENQLQNGKSALKWWFA